MSTFKKDEVYKEALGIAKEDGIYFISDITALISCGKTTFYELFPANSEESENIKGLLTKNKINTKKSLRKRLAEGEKAAEILALYKLIGNEDERKALSSNYHDITSKGKEINIPLINWVEQDGDK